MTSRPQRSAPSVSRDLTEASRFLVPHHEGFIGIRLTWREIIKVRKGSLNQVRERIQGHAGILPAAVAAVLRLPFRFDAFAQKGVAYAFRTKKAFLKLRRIIVVMHFGLLASFSRLRPDIDVHALGS